jgi:hypothetical protein
MNLKLYIHIFFKKNSYIKFKESLSSGIRVFVPYGQMDRSIDILTDRFDEASSRFSQFWKSAKNTKVYLDLPKSYAVKHKFNFSLYVNYTLL